MDIAFDINILSYLLKLEGINCSISLNNKCSEPIIFIWTKINLFLNSNIILKRINIEEDII